MARIVAVLVYEIARGAVEAAAERVRGRLMRALFDLALWL